MIDHANELRRHARKIGRPAGDTPAVMRAAAAHIDDLERRLQTAESRAAVAVEAEREACAKLCGDYWDYLDIGEDDYQDGRGCAALDLQSAIRARNKPPKN